MGDDIRVIDFGTYNETALEPLTAVLVAVAAVLTFSLRQRWAILPMIAVAALVPYPQRVVIGLLNFDMMRLVYLCALVRICVRKEWAGLQLARLDKLFLWWAVTMFIIPVLADPGHLKQSAGFVLDNIGGYLVIRSLVSDQACLKPVAKAFVVLSIIVCAGMLVERKLGKNLFYVLGSFEKVTVRQGQVRATAGFDHPILAGTFGAIVFPLAFVLREGNRRERWLWILGIVTSILIVLTSKSSGPLYGLIAGVFAMALWPVRQYVKMLRNAMWLILVLLYVVMNAPPWAVIHRIPSALGLVSGSTSYHRYQLITLAVEHIGQWWLCGISIDEVAKRAWGIQDITNQFLAIGFTSGVLGMILFLGILVRSFSLIGRCAHCGNGYEDMQVPWYAWILGSVLFVHVMSFFGVSYFSGFAFFLNLTFALIAAYCSAVEQSQQRKGTTLNAEGSAATEPSTLIFASLDSRVGVS